MGTLPNWEVSKLVYGGTAVSKTKQQNLLTFQFHWSEEWKEAVVWQYEDIRYNCDMNTTFPLRVLLIRD